MKRIFTVLYLALALALSAQAFAPQGQVARTTSRTTTFRGALHMSESTESDTTAAATAEPEAASAEEEEPMDEATRIQLEKQRKADELRAQEVFMKKSTGKHKCTNCDFEYDEAKGDSYLIGGMVQPGTPFAELPSNWRCPTCRASKDSFLEVVEEIPGFEVNQGYGFGTNSMTSGQKSGLIFGGLGLFFLLFLSGYAMN